LIILRAEPDLHHSKEINPFGNKFYRKSAKIVRAKATKVLLNSCVPTGIWTAVATYYLPIVSSCQNNITRSAFPRNQTTPIGMMSGVSLQDIGPSYP
jgi:putative effector of murein hydrolase